MFGRKEDEAKTTDRDTTDEHAYEDNWYRSLKALAQQREGTHVDEDLVEIGAESGTEPQANPAGSGVVQDVVPPTELETRAGQLLERLHALQRLSDPENDESDPPPSSVRQG